MVAADVGRAPAGGRSPEGGSGGGTPAGPFRSFPSPQGQVPSVRASAALPRLSPGVEGRGAGRRFKDSGGAVRHPRGRAPGRAAVEPPGAGVAPAQALATAAAARAGGCPSGSRAGEGCPPCPPFSAVRSRRRGRGAGPAAAGPVLPRNGGTPARGAWALLPGRWRFPAVGSRRAGRPRWAAASPAARSGALWLRALPAHPPPHAPAKGGLRRRPAASRRGKGRRSPGPERRRRRRCSACRPAAARCRPRGRPCPGPCPSLRSRLSRCRSGEAGWAAEGRSPSRSPRGSGERGRRPRLSGVRLSPGACLRKGPRREATAAVSGRAAVAVRWPGGGPAERRAAAAASRRLGFRRWPARPVRCGAAAAPRGEFPAGRAGVGARGRAGCRSAVLGGAEARAEPAGARPAAARAAGKHACLAPTPPRARGGQAGRGRARRGPPCGGRAEPGRLGRLRSEQGACFSPGRSGARAPRPLPFGV